MSEAVQTSSEAPHDSTLFGRVKQAVGLAPGPKEHKLDIQEHETEVSPRIGETPQTSKAEMPFKETYTTTPQQLAEQEGAFEGAELVEAPPRTTRSSEEESPVTPTPSLQEEPSRQGEEETLRQEQQQPSSRYKEEEEEETPASRQQREGKGEKASRIGVQKLLKPQEVEVGMEKPQYSTSQELPTEVAAPTSGTTTQPGASSLEPISEKQHVASTATATPQTPTLPSTFPTTHGQRGRRREDLTEKAIKDMESRGFKHVSGSEAATAAQLYEQQQQRASETQGKGGILLENPLFEKTTATTTAGEEKEEGVSEPTEREKVEVSRGAASFPGAYKATTTTTTTDGAISPRYLSTTGYPEYIKKGGISGATGGAGGIQEVYARPDYEVSPMEGGDIAAMKAKEHAIIAEEAGRKAAAKQQELHQLRRQADQLEKQSAALMEEAESERKRIEAAQEKLEEIEQGEWRGYAQAERAEQQRRAVVAKAKPAVRTAESREREAMVQKQLAADAHFHAQVLENRARSLLKESQDMAGLSLKLSTEASRVNSEMMIVRQDAQELKQQIDTHAARGLPDYINECQKEIGVLSHRITQLREEISWAEGEMERGREEADTWRRVVVAKEGQGARLLLRLTQLNESAEEARRRSKSAAEEARIPTELAEQKYDEAWAAAKAAEAAEEEAKRAQQEALEVVKGAVEPEQERQRALREAAAAESVAVQFETKAGVVAGKVQRRVYEAEVQEKTAAAKQEEATRTEEELAREKEIEKAEEKMAETYREQQKEHHPIAVPAI